MLTLVPLFIVAIALIYLSRNPVITPLPHEDEHKEREKKPGGEW